MGTYTAQTSRTDSSCWRADENDNVTHFTQTASASENEAFHSKRAIVLTVSRLLHQRTFDAGSFPRLSTAFTITRTSTANSP